MAWLEILKFGMMRVQILKQRELLDPKWTSVALLIILQYFTHTK